MSSIATRRHLHENVPHDCVTWPELGVFGVFGLLSSTSSSCKRGRVENREQTLVEQLGSITRQRHQHRRKDSAALGHRNPDALMRRAPGSSSPCSPSRLPGFPQSHHKSTSFNQHDRQQGFLWDSLLLVSDEGAGGREVLLVDSWCTL